jgi:hypothetical protein
VNFRSIIASLAAGIMLAGCSTATPLNLTPGSKSFSGASKIDKSRGASVMIYVSSKDTGSVYGYPYPRARNHISVSGLSQPATLCSDAAGNVWVPESGAQDIVEFPHDATKPTTRLRDRGQVPVGCSIDPVSGNLAVANAATGSGGSGSVSIYTRASGHPRVIQAFATTSAVSYEDDGNLYVDGLGQTGTFAIGEIKPQQQQVVDLDWTGPSITLPGGLQAVGTSIVLNDRVGSVLYSVRIDKRTATVNWSAPLQGYPNKEGDVVQFIVFPSTHRIICADAYNKAIIRYRFPLPGAPLDSKDLTGGTGGAPSGVAISETKNS